MKALLLTIQKLWPSKNFCAQTDRWTNGQAKNYMPPDLSMWGHKKVCQYWCEKVRKHTDEMTYDFDLDTSRC